MKPINQLPLVFILLVISTNCFSQLLETRNTIGVSSGFGNLTGTGDNLFFPSNTSQSTFSVDINYGHRINTWLQGGLAFGYSKFAGSPSSPGFAQIVSNGGTFFSGGPMVVVHPPFKPSGWMNRIRIGLMISPQFYHYSGERSLIIDNEVYSSKSIKPIVPVLTMNGTSSGFATTLEPGLNYRITQRFGLKLAYNLQMLVLSTGYGHETVFSNSLSGGMVFTFGHSKSLF